MNGIDRVYEAVRQAIEEPEGISVYVVGTDDPRTAEAIGPALAARLYPGRLFGKVLHVEATDVNAPGFEVVVQDYGFPRKGPIE